MTTIMRNKKTKTPVWNITRMERAYRSLTRGELKGANKVEIEFKFKKCLEYLLLNEEFERAAVLRDANIRWKKQLNNESV